MKRIERDRIVRRVYVGECAGSRSVGRHQKILIDTVKECLMQRGLDSVPVRSRYKNLSERREPSDYVSFRRVIKR